MAVSGRAQPVPRATVCQRCVPCVLGRYFVLVPPSVVGQGNASTCVSTKVVPTVARGEVSVMARLGAMPTLVDYDAALSAVMADHASPGLLVPCLRPSQRYIVGVYGSAEAGSKFVLQASEVHNVAAPAPRVTGECGWVRRARRSVWRA